MAFDLLLLSTDQKIITAIRIASGIFSGRDLTVMADAQVALRSLNKKHYDALIVDAEIPGSLALIEVLNAPRWKQRCTTFGVSKTSGESLSVQFVLQRPLSIESATRSFKAASGLIAKEHRRYYRHELGLAISLTVGGSDLPATLDNISTGGIAVRLGRGVETGLNTQFQFQLPGGDEIRGEGKIVWSSGQHAGIRFGTLKNTHQQNLERWFERQPA